MCSLAQSMDTHRFWNVMGSALLRPASEYNHADYLAQEEK